MEFKHFLRICIDFLLRLITNPLESIAFFYKFLFNDLALAQYRCTRFSHVGQIFFLKFKDFLFSIALKLDRSFIDECLCIRNQFSGIQQTLLRMVYSGNE